MKIINLKIFYFKYRSLIILFVCLLNFQNTFSQFYNFPGEYFSSTITEKNLAAKDSSIHSGIKPYIPFFSKKYVNMPDTFRIFKYIVDDPGLDAMFFKHVIEIDPHGYNFKITIDPLLNIELGTDIYNGAKNKAYYNTRGLIVAGNIGNNVYFESLIAENQSIFPEYLGASVLSNSIVPGQGRWKKFKSRGFDYAFSSGFVSLQANKNLNIQFGHGKQKIGNGYRSLLLSDNAFNYPYARITQQWFKGRVQYNNIYAALMNLTAASAIPTKYAEPLMQKKAAAFQYLSINPFKFLNIGFFQGLIWRAGDQKNQQHLTWQYYNPLIFSNALQKGLNDSNNVLVGADIKIKITNKINLYGQVMADDLSGANNAGQGIGYQGGICYYDAFTLKNLFLQGEYNQVLEASYLSPPTTRANQSYSHLNQYLAFTPGYGEEFVFILDYKFKRMFVNFKYQQQIVPSGGDYFYNTEIASGKIGYLINPAYNLNVSVGYTYRNQNFPNFKDLSNQTNYFFFGIRTSLYNLYYDF